MIISLSRYIIKRLPPPQNFVPKNYLSSKKDMNVPRLGLSSHPNLQSSHSQGSGVGIHSDNTTIDDFLAHSHPGAAATTMTDHLALSANSVLSTSTSSTQNNNNNNSNSNSYSNSGTNMFDNSSSGKPGSISPRPSRGVNNNNNRSSYSRQPSLTNTGVGNSHQQQPQHHSTSALRRSPSMPSTATADISSSYYPSQHQYSFELKKTSSSFKPLEKISRINPTCYQLGNNTENNNNPPITAIAASSRGTNLAWGDFSGRVFFLERENDTNNDDDGDDEDENNNNDVSDDDDDDPGYSFSAQKNKRRSSRSTARNKMVRKFRMPMNQPFSPVHGATCYTSYVDPLSSQDIRPAVTALSFLPETSPATLLITANEKTPKLWRLVKVPSLAAPIRSVDMIGSRQVGPLTNPEQPTSVLKEVRKFNVDHEYNIHSLCVIRDGTQFVSADEVTIRLWNVEYEHRGLLVSSENSPNNNNNGGGEDNNNNTTTVGGDNSEVINLVHSAPHAPHTLLVGLSGGQVRVSDLRSNLKIQNSNNNNSATGALGGDGSSLTVGAAQPPGRSCDGLYRAVASATIGCDLSLCGNYIAQRDVSCLHLFDIRKATSSSSSNSVSSTTSLQQPPPCLVNRWVLQDHVAKNFGQLYQLGSLFEKVAVRFVGSRIVTGGFGECLITVNALDATNENVEVRKLLCETEPENVEVQMGEFGESNLTTSDDDVARIYREARRMKGNDREISARYGFLSSSASQQNHQHDGDNSDDESNNNVTSSASAIIPALTADEATRQHFSNHNLHSDEGRGEWKRITKLCVLPSPSWVGLGGGSGGRSSFGEILATCGDSVHHVGMSI